MYVSHFNEHIHTPNFETLSKQPREFNIVPCTRQPDTEENLETWSIRNFKAFRKLKKMDQYMKLPRNLSTKLETYINSNGQFLHTHPLAPYLLCCFRVLFEKKTNLQLKLLKAITDNTLPKSLAYVPTSPTGLVTVMGPDSDKTIAFNHANVKEYRMTIQRGVPCEPNESGCVLQTRIRISQEGDVPFSYFELRNMLLIELQDTITTVDISCWVSEEVTVMALCATYEVYRSHNPYRILIWRPLTLKIIEMLSVLLEVDEISELLVVQLPTEIPALSNAMRLKTLKLIDPIKAILPKDSTAITTIEVMDNTLSGAVISALPWLISTMPCSLDKFVLTSRSPLLSKTIGYVRSHLKCVFPVKWPSQLDFCLDGATFGSASVELRRSFIQMVNTANETKTSITGEMVAMEIERYLNTYADGDAFHALCRRKSIPLGAMYLIYTAAVSYEMSFAIWDYVENHLRAYERQISAEKSHAGRDTTSSPGRQLIEEEMLYIEYLWCRDVLRAKPWIPRFLRQRGPYDPLFGATNTGPVLLEDYSPTSTTTTSSSSSAG